MVTVIVDLEWSTGKVKAYGNKRGWVAVTKLVASYHEKENASADDLDDLRESQMIADESLYESILAAPTSLQSRSSATRAQYEAHRAMGPAPVVGVAGGGGGAAAQANSYSELEWKWQIRLSDTFNFEKLLSIFLGGCIVNFKA